jgi:predicted acylesterase/phospholipase RssA
LAYDVEKRKPRLISSYDDSNISVISAINATSAAPLYYPTVKIEDGSWLIDGGVVANNPSLIGYNEARNYFKTSNIKVFSIGTGINSKGLDGKSSAEWGPIGWLRNDILGILSETQYDHETLSDLLKEDYLRINSSMKEINFSMDDYSHENLEKIKKMGMFWWSEFGDRAIKFLDSN